MKSKELFPAVFSRHALAYQQRPDEIMERGEALGRLRVIELVDAKPVDQDRRQRFGEEAIATLKIEYPGAIETTGRNPVLFGIA